MEQSAVEYEKLDELLAQMARDRGMTKDEVMRRYGVDRLGASVESPPRTVDEFKEIMTTRMMADMLRGGKGGEKGSDTAEMFNRLILLKMLPGDKRDEAPKESTMDRIMAYGMMRQFFAQPASEAVQVAAKAGEWDKVEQLLERQAKENREMLQQVMVDKRMEEVKKGAEEKVVGAVRELREAMVEGKSKESDAKVVEAIRELREAMVERKRGDEFEEAMKRVLETAKPKESEGRMADAIRDLKDAMLDRKRKDEDERVAKELGEVRQRLEAIAAAPPRERRMLVQELSEEVTSTTAGLKTLKDSLVELGMIKEEEVTTKEGKIDWGKVATKGLEVIREGIQAVRASPPQREIVETQPVGPEFQPATAPEAPPTPPVETPPAAPEERAPAEEEAPPPKITVHEAPEAQPPAEKPSGEARPAEEKPGKEAPPEEKGAEGKPPEEKQEG